MGSVWSKRWKDFVWSWMFFFLTFLALIGVCGDVHEYPHFPPCWDYWKQSGIDIGVIWSDKVFAVFTIHYTSIPRLWAGKSDSTQRRIKFFCISDGCRRPRYLSENTFVLISSKGGLSASHLHPKSNKCCLRRISRIERVLEEQERIYLNDCLLMVLTWLV